MYAMDHIPHFEHRAQPRRPDPFGRRRSSREHFGAQPDPGERDDVPDRRPFDGDVMD